MDGFHGLVSLHALDETTNPRPLDLSPTHLFGRIAVSVATPSVAEAKSSVSRQDHLVIALMAQALVRPHGMGAALSFWKRGSFRSGSNIGSSRSSAGVSGAAFVRPPS